MELHVVIERLNLFDAEVAHLGRAFGGEKYIARLNVPVQGIEILAALAASYEAAIHLHRWPSQRSMKRARQRVKALTGRSNDHPRADQLQSLGALGGGYRRLPGPRTARAATTESADPCVVQGAEGNLVRRGYVQAAGP